MIRIHCLLLLSLLVLPHAQAKKKSLKVRSAEPDVFSPRIHGEFRIRPQARTAEPPFHASVTDSTDGFFLRGRAGMSVDPWHGMSFLFQPQFSAPFGEKDGISGGGIDPGVSMHQVYFIYRTKKSWQFKLGRMEMAFGKERVIGDNDWENVGRAFDAIWVNYKFSEKEELAKGFHFYDATLFFAKIHDQSLTKAGLDAGGGDHDFIGFYSTFQSPGLDDLDIYIFENIDQRGSKPARLLLTTVGGRASSTWGDRSLALFFEVEGNWQR